MTERAFTLADVKDVIKNCDRKYVSHGHLLAFERKSVRVVVDPHSVTVVTVMWIFGR